MILRAVWFDTGPLQEALSLLPAQMTSPEARCILIAIGLQESRLEHRFQIVQGRPDAKGPARGLLQFERGGGVAGVLTHPHGRRHAQKLCEARGVRPNSREVWLQLEHDDVLAAGFGRLLLWTDPQRLPAIGDSQGAWDTYIRIWRPGKPHRHTWDSLYSAAVEAVRK